MHKKVRLLFENQTFSVPLVPMAFGLFASFIGLFSMFFPKSVMRFVLWSYFAVLSPIEMDYDAQTRVTNYIVVNPDWGAFAVIIGTLIVLYLFGRTLFERKEI
jgi:lantibiotic transport system permease protein